MQITEFCGMSFQNLAAVELLHPEPNRGDHDGACTHTASLQEAARRDSETEKQPFRTTIHP